MITEHPVSPSASIGNAKSPWWRWVVPVVLGATVLTIFGFMRADQVFVANTPTGGDMGAHVLLPSYLRDSLLSEGRLLGWSNDWYAGFPVFYFYFPIPAFAIVLLDVILPYGVAFKLVTVAGLLAMPLAAYYLARGIGFSRPVSLVAGVSGGMFVFMESFSIYGGNTLSTLAGEFSFSWSFALSLFYLGSLIRDVREGRGFTARTAIFLALTALCHIITTLIVVVASLPLLVRRKGASAVVSTWAVGLALAAFWVIPFLANVGYSTDMGWTPVQGIDKVFPRELWPLLVPAAVGLAWALARRHIVGPLVMMMAFPIAGYYFIQFIDFRKLYNARLLPYWYFTVYLLAGIGIGFAVEALARRMRGGVSMRWGAAGAAAVVVLLIGASGVHRTPSWARWNYTGYEGRQAYGVDEVGDEVLQADYWAEYQAFLSVIDTLPPGRVMWENNNDLNRYGTPMALMLTPYWSEGHPSMEGLLFESSLSTPFHFLNAAEVSIRSSNAVAGLQYRNLSTGTSLESRLEVFDRGVRHLAFFDVEYYVSFTEEATETATAYGLPILATSGPFTVYELPAAPLVEVAAWEPAIYDGELSFTDATLEWYDDVDNLDRWMVESGPADWKTVATPDDVTRDRVSSRGFVSNVVLENHSISFDTTAVGVPHMIKVSYFPNWTASGADGPYRSAPSFMVVVPTEEHVELSFDEKWPETLGKTTTAVTILALIGLAIWRRRSQDEPAEELKGV